VDTRELLPGQDSLPKLDGHDDSSHLHLILGRTNLLEIWAMFPFDTASPEFVQYASSFAADLSLQFHPNGWRTWAVLRGRWKAKRIEVPRADT
jgi:hypothetical protein